jgi:hypothetical protein
MGFFRRLFGGESNSPSSEIDRSEDAPTVERDPATVEDDERARDLELLREEQERLDELARRQLRYAEYAWEPPAQGGERRADDADTGAAAGDR